MNTSTPLEVVRSWPLPKRLEFVFLLWDEILDSGTQPGLPDELKAELDRRWAAYQANPANVRTWEQIQSRLGQKP
jgi:putative addiction module component (TIGR02574 family)